MASMSYCVFENTTPDLELCVEKLKDGKVLSPYEEPYRHSLYELCKEYIDAYENYQPIEDEDDDE